MSSQEEIKKMGADIIAEIQRGRKVGYSDKLIKKSLELSGYSSESIKQAFKELEKRKNGSNGNGFIVHTTSIKKGKKDNGKADSAKNAGPADSGQNYQDSSEGVKGLREPLQPALAKPTAAKKNVHWLRMLIEIVLGILIFSVVGIMLYLYFLPAVSNTVI
jgi:hypothetical protein